MASNELAIRFTETKYATKNEVAKELKTSLVDTFWHNILAYRSNFNHYLSLKSIDKNMFVYCGCQSMDSLMASIEGKIQRINEEFSRVCADPKDKKYFVNNNIVKSLKAVADKNDLEVTEPYIRSLLNDELKEVAASHQVLVNYLNTLRYASRKYTSEIDDNYLADLFQKFNNVDEITVYYRNKEDTNRENRVIIDRIYTCAPIHLIDNMMNHLFGFITGFTLSSVVKALIVYFYLNYIRPFNSYSDELAMLMMKSILAHEGFGEAAMVIPFESLMRNNEDIGKLFADVQKTNDVTYFVRYMGKLMEKICDDTLDDLANLNAEILKKDYYVEDEQPVEDAPQEQVTYTEPTTIIEEPSPIIENKVEEIKQPVVQQISKPVEEEKPQKVEVRYVKQELAVSYIPPALDEKEAYRLEVHLREMDPSLKKGEAKFYARHCVVGKKYTIQQFKKYIGCAYETARTSMDHLADLGYYRKEQVKNKFVYSPIPR